MSPELVLSPELVPVSPELVPGIGVLGIPSPKFRVPEIRGEPADSDGSRCERMRNIAIACRLWHVKIMWDRTGAIWDRHAGPN